MDNSIYNVYIDESGDEGIRKGTRWFLLSAAIIKKDNDLDISHVVDELKDFLKIPNNKMIHWKEIRNKNVSKKRYIIDRIAKEDFLLINIAVDTYNIKETKLQGKLVYHYTCRFLMERICWAISALNGSANIIFSNKASISYEELESYIKSLHLSKYCINSFEVKPAYQRKLLQFVDCCCGALSEALENDSLGYIDERYIMTIKDKLYRRNGNLFSYGIKIFPSENMDDYRAEYEWLNEI